MKLPKLVALATRMEVPDGGETVKRYLDQDG
jgi:hypothetical protein